MEKTQKRQDKTMYIIEKFYRNVIIDRILPLIDKTFITPNMITIFNMFFSFYIFWLAYNKEYILVAIFFQLYELIDHLDGSLARYKNMSSNIGAKLDTISDFIFYNFIYVFIGLGNVKLEFIALVITFINLYAIIATYYIVPRLKKLKVIKRKRIKRWFMNRGYIIGMDLTLLGLLTSLFLIFNKIYMLYIIIILAYVLDIVYRIKELKNNEALKENRM